MFSLRFAIAIVAIFLSCFAVECFGQMSRNDAASFQRQLRRRVAKEQAARYAMIEFVQRASRSQKGFDTERYDKLTKKASDIDGDNLAWLKEIEEKQGFPSAQQLNQKSGEQLFLLLLHADRDPEFRRKILTHMKSEESAWPEKYINLLQTRLKLTEHTQLHIPAPDEKQTERLRPTEQKPPANTPSPNSLKDTVTGPKTGTGTVKAGGNSGG